MTAPCNREGWREPASFRPLLAAYNEYCWQNALPTTPEARAASLRCATTAPLRTAQLRYSSTAQHTEPRPQRSAPELMS
eukprot:6188502-Pleurochrysis_carterae.AAC.3